MKSFILAALLGELICYDDILPENWYEHIDQPQQWRNQMETPENYHYKWRHMDQPEQSYHHM
jgi:hypothetical protein